MVSRLLRGVKLIQEVYYTFVNYEDELSAISSAISDLAIEQQELTQQIADEQQTIVEGVGVMTALIGMLIGFFAIVELLKVWLE